MSHMLNTLSAKLVKPTNKKLGSLFNVDESTVRHWKKNKPKQYEEHLLKYRLKRSPFITESEFINAYDKEADTIVENNFNNNGKIPTIVDLNSKPLYPTNLINILSSKERIKKYGTSVLSCSNYKGGVGKTTTAINLSTTFAYYGYNVLFVDFDIQGNSTSMFDIYQDVDFDKTLVDLLYSVEEDNASDIVKDSIINLNDRIKTIGKFDIIPNCSELENAEKFEDLEKSMKTYGNINQTLDEVISFVKDDYDFVIIDTPPSIALPLRMSVLATDYFLIVLQPDKMAKDGMPSFIKPIEKNAKAYKRHKQKDIVVLGGIMNMYQENVNIHKINNSLIKDDLENTIENSHLGESTVFESAIKRNTKLIEAQNDLGSILLYEPTNELVRDYFNLADEIIDNIIIDKISKS